ncbi:hypothetical protein, partial [Aquicoccus porphyridii]|uniref:hypothetical protein n=1 Tax=Aquicoccus porphyridii TaxID=1852029 RepID=UPI00273D9AC8
GKGKGERVGVWSGMGPEWTAIRSGRPELRGRDDPIKVGIISQIGNDTKLLHKGGWIESCRVLTFLRGLPGSLIAGAIPPPHEGDKVEPPRAFDLLEYQVLLTARGAVQSLVGQFQPFGKAVPGFGWNDEFVDPEEWPFRHSNLLLYVSANIDNTLSKEWRYVK